MGQWCKERYKISDEPKDSEIFVDDVDELVLQCYPDHEGQHDLLKKFGVRTGGICDGWWFNDEWRSLPELDKWRYVAYCSLYWLRWYEYWFYKKELSNGERGHKS